MSEQSLQDLKDRGKAALRDSDLDLAIECFSKVLNISQDAETFIDRARAYRKQKSSLLEAAEDAKHACRLDPTKAVGFIEQGKILYELEEYESAKKCFETALKLEPGKKLVQNWLGMCCVALGEKVPESSTEGDGEQQRLIQKHVETYKDSDSKVGPSRVKIDDEEYRKYWSTDKAPVAQVPVAKRFDHSWFQSPTGVEVDILAKNINPETVHVEFSTDSIHVQVQNGASKQGEPEYSKRFDLFGLIDPAESRYEVLKSKIEIKLRKKDTSVQWGSLEKSSEPKVALAAPSWQPASDQKGKGTKDWSKIEKQIAGDDQDEEEKDSNVLNFFQKLYAGADEDTRRAMMKSYQESGGTSLSTNWKDVSARDFSKEND